MAEKEYCGAALSLCLALIRDRRMLIDQTRRLFLKLSGAAALAPLAAPACAEMINGRRGR